MTGLRQRALGLLSRRGTFAIDLYLLIRQPRIELARWWDFLRTRRRLKFLRFTDLPNNQRSVLLPLLGDRIFDLKQHMMLATALRMRGWNVTVLCKPSSERWVKRYGRSFGIGTFVQLRDVPAPEAELSEVIDELLKHAFSIQQIKSWTFRGAWIGPQIVASLLRKPGKSLEEGLSELRNHPAALVDALGSTIMSENILKERGPDLVIVNEANYSIFGPLVDVAIAAGIDVIQYTQPWRDDALIFKRLNISTRRKHPNSVERSTLALLEKIPWTPAHEEVLNETLRDRYCGRWALQMRHHPTRGLGQPVQDALPKLKYWKPLAVIFSHVLWDANLFYGEDLFENYGHWLRETLEAAAANEEVEWILKIHPANVWKHRYDGFAPIYAEEDLIQGAFGLLPAHVHVLKPETNVSALALFEAADFGVTVRGTAGLEMACFGKSVLTAGSGRYSGLGFTVDSRSREEFIARLNSLPKGLAPMDQRQIHAARRHAYAAFLLRHWEMRSFSCSFSKSYLRGRRSPLDQNLHPTTRSLASIRAAGDLDLWADWAESSSTADYLDPVKLEEFRRMGEALL